MDEDEQGMAEVIEFTDTLADIVDRALKTAAQSAVLAIGAESLEVNAFAVDWSVTAGFALGGAILSILTNVAQRGLLRRN